MAKSLILTHIFEKDLDKRLDKAEVLLISPRRVALPGSFAKWIWKMWVRISFLSLILRLLRKFADLDEWFRLSQYGKALLEQVHEYLLN